jgi:hypothetical protein
LHDEQYNRLKREKNQSQSGARKGSRKGAKKQKAEGAKD